MFPAPDRSFWRPGRHTLDRRILRPETVKIAFFSDVHANLPALEAVLEDIDRRRPDVVFCLGDLVGYAPWPNEVVETVRRRAIPTIAGNYDEGVGLDSDDCGCAYTSEADKRLGERSIAFTNQIVTNDTRTFLRGLPRELRIAFEQEGEESPLHMLMVHGSPRRINEYLFEDRPDKSFLRMMRSAAADLMLFGHTHRPYHKALLDDVDGTAATRHAVNIGSVGKPKDGDPRACYVVVHLDPVHPRTAGPKIEFVRIEYDVDRAVDAIEESPLPDAFAVMLRDGR